MLGVEDYGLVMVMVMPIVMVRSGCVSAQWIRDMFHGRVCGVLVRVIVRISG